MRTFKCLFVLLFIGFTLKSQSYPSNIANTYSNPFNFISDSLKSYVYFEPNNIKTMFFYSGIFNQDLRTMNTPAFEWPAGSGKYAVFTTGLTIAGIVNGNLRMASASYSGEYFFGSIENGLPVFNKNFKFYKVKKGDTPANNPDYADWHLMIPYGAPYNDINQNGIYDPAIDIPGVKDAHQTLFVVLNDGLPTTHNANEGFGGGTAPLNAELRITAWGYDSLSLFTQLSDAQFVKFNIINKSRDTWEKVYFGLFADINIGGSADDYAGCDSALNLGYSYNADSVDSEGPYSYGSLPPAAGFKILDGPNIQSEILNEELYMTSFIAFSSHHLSPVCEMEPMGEPSGAYNFMRGTKKDGSAWINRTTMLPTRYCYSGDPETETGWTEKKGSVQNCGGTTGHIIPQNPSTNRKLLINMGNNNLNVAPGEQQEIVIAQMIAQGYSNFNSVTRLKELSVNVQSFYDSTSTSVTPSVIPLSFNLYQNYPNPFNPVTNIKFDIPEPSFTKITVFDITGKEISELVSTQLSAGTYEVQWDGAAFSSGIYFYRIETEAFTEVKKMMLLK